jgi:hypothetical protein
MKAEVSISKSGSHTALPVCQIEFCPTAFGKPNCPKDCLWSGAMEKKNESLNDLSIQISNLRKCRDGLIPYSTESLRQAKQSSLKMNPILTANATSSLGQLGNESRLRR